MAATAATTSSKDMTPRLSSHRATKVLPTNQAYELWAPTYDTDGNILQRVDDDALEDSLLPKFKRKIEERCRSASDVASSGGPIRILDLGCGTGRNTTKLLSLRFGDRALEVTGLDASGAMLSIARTKCASVQGVGGSSSDVTAVFEVCDFADPARVPDDHCGRYDAVLSTLVLEHLSLSAFFDVIAKVLKPGGVALVTNMHPDMGAVSRAGFLSADGVKVAGESRAHSIEETVEAAEIAGLEVDGGIGGLEERGVAEEMLEKLGPRGRKWIGTMVWFGFIAVKKRSSPA